MSLQRHIDEIYTWLFDGPGALPLAIACLTGGVLMTLWHEAHEREMTFGEFVRMPLVMLGYWWCACLQAIICWMDDRMPDSERRWPRDHTGRRR